MSYKETWKAHSITKTSLPTVLPSNIRQLVNTGIDVKAFYYDHGHNINYCTPMGDFYLKNGKERAFSVNKNGYRAFDNVSCHRILAYMYDKLNDFNDHTKVIDHIDNNKLNNHISNIRVISQKENVAKRDINGHARAVKIDVYNWHTGELYKTFNSLKECSEDIGVAIPNICSHLNKRSPQRLGKYTVSHQGEPIYIPCTSRKPRTKKVKTDELDPRCKYKYDIYKNEELVNTCYSLLSVARFVGTDKDKHDVLRHFNGQRSSVKGYTIVRSPLNEETLQSNQVN